MDSVTGLSAVRHTIDNRKHDRDEVLGIRVFYEGQEILDKLLKSLAGEKTSVIKK